METMSQMTYDIPTVVPKTIHFNKPITNVPVRVGILCSVDLMLVVVHEEDSEENKLHCFVDHASLGYFHSVVARHYRTAVSIWPYRMLMFSCSNVISNYESIKCGMHAKHINK